MNLLPRITSFVAVDSFADYSCDYPAVLLTTSSYGAVFLRGGRYFVCDNHISAADFLPFVMVACKDETAMPQ